MEFVSFPKIFLDVPSGITWICKAFLHPLNTEYIWNTSSNCSKDACSIALLTGGAEKYHNPNTHWGTPDLELYRLEVRSAPTPGPTKDFRKIQTFPWQDVPHNVVSSCTKLETNMMILSFWDPKLSFTPRTLSNTTSVPGCISTYLHYVFSFYFTSTPILICISNQKQQDACHKTRFEGITNRF